MRHKVWVLIGVSGTAVAVMAGLVIGRTIWPTPNVISRSTVDDQSGFGSLGERGRTADHGVLRVELGKRPVPRHDIGSMTRGTRREVSFVMSNNGSTAVTVGTIRVSCDCFRVELDATRVEPGTEVGGRAVIDLAHEPGFAGGLTLHAVSLDDGQPAFALKLFVSVK